ncbi:hypothetical protein [Microbacterium lacus]|uniref:hypothetical protein n=1 Tax=Microbacterium lacus TaxID=415217 RepID=UPI000C2B8700|nr:hypothetical protein [Microbacterium lacus]
MSQLSRVERVVASVYFAGMPSGPDFLQMTIAILSVPAVAAAITWLARRFSKESRLLLRLERLAAIYPNLPAGSMQDEFAKRVTDAGSELNARLDPLFKQERRRKRTVIVSLVVGSAFVILLWPGHAALEPGGSNLSSLALGVIAVAAFLFIERDTRRQRAAIKDEQSGQSSAL